MILSNIDLTADRAPQSGGHGGKVHPKAAGLVI